MSTSVNFEKQFEINRDTWNKKADAHYEGEFYDIAGFKKTLNSLNAYEIKALGDVRGKKLLHLQCHFGQDTLSWAAKGAQVTGIDISDQAITLAKQLAVETSLEANFVRCNTLEVAEKISGDFDIVFTSYGVIGWLPDLKPWAQVIAKKLKTGGKFYIVEFHPIAWMYDYTVEPPVMKYHYAQEREIYEEYEGTYGNQQSNMISKEYGWNHGLSEVIQSLIDAGLQVEQFSEYDASPYDVFPNLKKNNEGLFEMENQLFPLIFEIIATKK